MPPSAPETPQDSVPTSLAPAVALPRLQRDPRLADRVQEILLRQILELQLRPGHPLPSERALGEQLGVSRSTVREAVRALIAKGILEARSGSGIRVAEVGGDYVSESMSLFLNSTRSVNSQDLHEVRATLEIQIAGLAAERATVEDVATLRQRCDELAGSLDDPDSASEHDVQFHRDLARATKNGLFLVLLDSIAPALYELRRASLRLPGRAQVALTAHRELLAAVEARDAAEARTRMRAHLIDSNRNWAQLAPDWKGSDEP